MKKAIEFWEVKVRFLVRKGSHAAATKRELIQNVRNGIGANDMNCIDAEDLSVEVK
jgi:hypothetical protein